MPRRLTVTSLESRDVPSFGAGDLVVYRVGDGSAALTTAAAAVFLDEYTPAGALVQSIPVSTTGAGQMTASGSSATEGVVSMSGDGTHLIFSGYRTAVGTANPAAVSPATINRVIGTVDASGTINTSVAVSSGTAVAIRSAASASGNGTDPFYIATAALVGYVPNGSSTATSIDARNSREVDVYGTTVYASNASTSVTAKVQSYGTLPTGTTTPTAIASLAMADGVNGFFFCRVNSTDTFAGPDTLYALDPIANLLYKFSTGDGITWSSDGSFAAAGAQPNITGVVNGGAVQLYISSGPSVYDVTDSSGYGGTLTGSLGAAIFTAPANEAFRGISIAPALQVGTAATNVSVGSNGSPTLVGAPVTFTATVTAASTPTGSVAFKYNGAVLGTVTLVPGATGTATAQFITSALPIGTDTVTAAYSGDPTYAPNSNTVNQIVNGSLTTTGVTSNNALPTLGQSVMFTATVTANSGITAPSGGVSFFDNGIALNTTPVPLVAGSGLMSAASLTVATNAIQTAQMLTPGSHTITAVFTPNPGFVTSSSPALVQNVKANAFGGGDLLVYRAGDGTNALSADGNAVYVDEYTTAGTLVQSLVMPTTSVAGGNQALITCSQQSVEGQLSLSGDGQYVFLTGYDAPLGGSVDLHTSSATAIPRTIGRIKMDGTIDTSMALTDLANNGSVRGVYSPDGSQVYATGSTGGIRYVGSYSAATTTSTQIDAGANALNEILAADGQLYVSAGSAATATTATVKIASVSGGLPTSGVQSLTTLSGIPTLNTTPIYPQGFFFTTLMGPSVGPDTLYIADNGNFANGTISKWSYSTMTTSWTLTDTITSGTASVDNPTVPSFDNVTGTINGSTVTLYASYGNGGSTNGPGDLYSITDSGGFGAVIPSHTATTLASVSSTSKETFRGVAVVPAAPPTVASVVASDGVAADGTAQRSEVRQVQITFSSPVTFAGGNANAAAAFQLQRVQNSANVTLAAAVNATNTVVTLTFSGAVTDPVSASNRALPSLADGNYQLTIFSANVSSASTGAPLAGGGASGNYISPAQSAFVAGQPNLFRIFGDATGNGFVDSQDLGQFRSTYNLLAGNTGYLAYLDANNSGSVDSQDLGQFRSRYNNNAFS